MPTLHAFLVGVSHYRHLAGGTGPTAQKTLGLAQLTCAAISAWHFHQWLQTAARSGELAFTLADPFLLLAPSPAERTQDPRMPVTEEPTLKNIRRRIYEWRERVARARDDLALFYFAGHGIQETKQDAILLASDVCDPAEPQPLLNSFRLANIVNGMAPAEEPGPDDRRDIARTQVFLVDACRVRPAEVKLVARTVAQSLFEEPLSVDQDDRSTPVIQSAQAGESSFGRPADDTLFMRALLRSLRGGAARRQTQPNGDVAWRVTLEGLRATMCEPEYFREFNDGIDTGQVPTSGGSTSGGRDLVHLNSSPMVRLRLTADPPLHASTMRVELTSRWGANRPYGPPLPAAIEVPAGVWRFTADSAAPVVDELTLDPPSLGCVVRKRSI